MMKQDPLRALLFQCGVKNCSKGAEEKIFYMYILDVLTWTYIMEYRVSSIEWEVR